MRKENKEICWWNEEVQERGKGQLRNGVAEGEGGKDQTKSV